jgi:hypothetical protein
MDSIFIVGTQQSYQILDFYNGGTHESYHILDFYNGDSPKCSE